VSILLLAAALLSLAAPAAIQVTEGSVSIPTYVHSARETQPPLFAGSSVGGLYPFTTYVMPYQPGGPKPKNFSAIFIENEYLKLTYIPDFGGRIFSLYDKLRGREAFYRNDVLKPSHYNPRISWTQSGMEMTGPYDAHMLTLNGEPFWSHKIVRHPDGSVSLVLGEIDPVYHMKVNLTATLHPGVAALQMSVFCYNRRDARMPQMFWLSTALNATEKTRFIYPMTRTIGHTTSEIADWPVFNGTDYSWDRNNKHMLGVFGIDIYDDFQGAYMFDQDYGVFRYADRRIVQGMKMWTFGYGPGSKNLERGYTDNAGPYVEVQSGRHVWDGNYEWVGPHKVENWSEWWVPVAGIGGLTTIRRDVALNLETPAGSVKVALSAARPIPGARIAVRSSAGEIFSAAADLLPGKPWLKTAPVKGPLTGLTVTVTDASGAALLDYRRPDTSPGRQEYTPFTRPLERPAKKPEQMSVEELTLAAEGKFKTLSPAAAVDLLNRALALDAGYSRAHLLFGIHHFTAGRYAAAAAALEKAIERDPYLDEAHYYLAMSQFASGDEKRAERNLYYIWPHSAYFGEREYHLGRLAFQRGQWAEAVQRLERAIAANGYDLLSRQLLALTLRQRGEKERALSQLAEIERIDPTDRISLAERFFLSGDQAARTELVRLMGGQSQEAIDVSIFYRRVGRWKEAAEVLRMVERENKDPFGTPAEFYYTLAYCVKRAGDPAGASASLEKARAAAGNIDRFPYREESEAPLADAVEIDPKDAAARYLLGLLLYHRERTADAIGHWEAGVQSAPADWTLRRTLGLAYAEQGAPVEKAAAHLEKAVELNPAHVRTLNDLSSIYSKAGRFDEQVAVLQKALARSPEDDDLAEGILTANLVRGNYDAAAKIVDTHRFEPRHRSYGLRDKYRFMRYAMGAVAFKAGKYDQAAELFHSALKPPVSLGADDFVEGANPRLDYYLGRTLEAQGRKAEAVKVYQRGAGGAAQLSGDRDSLNSENFHMIYSLRRLGRAAEADRLSKRFADFARVELDGRNRRRHAEAAYLLALAEKDAGRTAEARRLLEQAIKSQPDFLPARIELRGDVPDPLN
jgi:tetratricopeptide (TPR) repeat protein